MISSKTGLLLTFVGSSDAIHLYDEKGYIVKDIVIPQQLHDILEEYWEIDKDNRLDCEFTVFEKESEREAYILRDAEARKRIKAILPSIVVGLRDILPVNVGLYVDSELVEEYDDEFYEACVPDFPYHFPFEEKLWRFKFHDLHMRGLLRRDGEEFVYRGDTPFLYECINKHLCYPIPTKFAQQGGRCHFVTVIEYIHPIFERVRQ